MLAYLCQEHDLMGEELSEGDGWIKDLFGLALYPPTHSGDCKSHWNPT